MNPAAFLGTAADNDESNVVLCYPRSAYYARFYGRFFRALRLE